MTNIPEILKNAKRIHFVGIGGSGMFPIAQILMSLGYEITGSDVLESSIIQKERQLGIDVKMGHKAENVVGADVLIVTAALLPGNPEVDNAIELGIPIIQRADMLGYLTHLYPNSVCISGTHGKTTTTALFTSMLILA
ncbi:MAG: UDP-N-acetylmuramate--L-alanine ligase, partial [Oscillospiraceae bacterium]|nr:UDP-N-acetylmuramate--L-alanine ligase [Oscillospiraceae bacterium]